MTPLQRQANVMRIYSWNVNGVRAAVRKGLGTWLAGAQPDILCLQETRLDAAVVPDELRTLHGYHSYWSPLRRPGYGGVATFSRQEPLSWQVGMGLAAFDDEARVLITEYPSFTLYNVYFPNGRSSRAWATGSQLRAAEAIAEALALAVQVTLTGLTPTELPKLTRPDHRLHSNRRVRKRGIQPIRSYTISH